MENETYGEHIRENDDPPVDGMGTFLWKKKYATAKPEGLGAWNFGRWKGLTW